MDCNRIAKLLSKSYDGELNARESTALEEHLRQRERCRLEDELWSKYEHGMAQYYGSKKLNEAFVMRVRERISRLDMDSPNHPHRHLSGQVNALAIRWLQPIGLAAGLILAVLLFVLRTNSNIIELLDGSGFFLSTETPRVAELTMQSQKDLLPGNLIWTNEYQRLRLKLKKGDIALDLAARGLLTVEPVTSQNEGVLSLHSGKIVVGGPGTPHRFVLNTAAGVVRGEAGRIGVSARWLSLPEKRWKAAVTSDSRSEAWRAVPIARVDVAEGRAEIALRQATADLAPGQSATISTVFAKPVLLPPQEAETAVEVVSIKVPQDSQPRIESQLIYRRDLPLLETVFVQIPLQAVLSCVAEIHPSQIELDNAAAMAPQNLRISQPLDVAPETTLAAIADFAGLTYRKELRSRKTELVDLTSKASVQASTESEPKLQIEIEGNSLRLLKGTGIRLSMLSRAIEDSLSRPVEPSSVDWPIAEFELRDIPKSKIPEVLGRELGLHFSQENRQVPIYHLEYNAAETNKTLEFEQQTENLKLSRQDTTLQQTRLVEQTSSPPDSHPAMNEIAARRLSGARTPNRQSLGKRQRDWWDRRFQDSENTAVGLSEISQSNAPLSAWIALWALRGTSDPNIAPNASDNGPSNRGASKGSPSGNPSTPMNSTEILHDAMQNPAKLPAGEWRRLAERALNDWSGELEFSRRLIFNLLPAETFKTAAQQAGDMDQQYSEKLFLGMVNSTSSAVWVRVDIKNTQGNCVDSSYVEISANSSSITTLARLLLGTGDAAPIAYIETESATPVAGMQAAVYGQHVELLRAQAVPPQQYFVSPLSIAGYGTAGINDTFLKLVNASDTYQHIRIFLLQERNPISLPIHELNLEPHAACQLAIDEMLRLRGVQLPERIAAGLGIETDQAGLVGFAWSTSMAKESSSYAWLLQAATCDNLPASFASIVAKSLCRE